MKRPRITHPETSLVSKYPSDLFDGLSREAVFRNVVRDKRFQSATDFMVYAQPVDAMMLMTEAVREADMKTSAVINWAVTSWARSGKVIMEMEEGLLDSLLRSKAPATLEWMPHMPHDCFYVSLEGCGLQVWNDMSEFHRVEGVYLCKDRVKRTADSAVVDAITVLVCGEDKGVMLGDAVLYFFLVEGSPLWFPGDDRYETERYSDMRKLVGALVVLLQMMSAGGDAVEREEVPALEKKGSLKKAKRRGVTPGAYSVIRLSKNARPRAPKGGEKRGPYTAWRKIAGHSRLFWYKHPPEDRPVVKEKMLENGQKRYGVVKYLFPFESRRGWNKDDRPRRVKVKR